MSKLAAFNVSMEIARQIPNDHGRYERGPHQSERPWWPAVTEAFHSLTNGLNASALDASSDKGHCLNVDQYNEVLCAGRLAGQDGMTKKPGFQPGQSGNPAGRPKGSRSRSTLALEAILQGEAEAVTRKVIELALAGDPQALRMCVDRLLPVRKDRPVQFDLPVIETTTDLPKATQALLQAVAAGDLTPSEAADISRSVDLTSGRSRLPISTNA